MKLCFTQLLLILFLLPLVSADLDSDQQALLAFAAVVPHGPKLDWSNATFICTSWRGIKCSSDGTNVLIVRLPAVGFTGPIPSNTLGELDALRVLSLRLNRLNGTLPSDLLSLPSLRSLFLQHNHFTGNIPAFFPRRLHILDLSFNSFTGNIPPTIQYLTKLTGLYLQNNSLSGPIPNVTFLKLKHVDMSYNNLSGSIPSSLEAFPYSSFKGNPFLCGLPVNSCSLESSSSSSSSSSSFPPPPPPPPPPAAAAALSPSPISRSKRKFPLWAIIDIAVGGILVVLLLVGLLVLCCYLTKKSSGASGLRLRSGESFYRRRYGIRPDQLL